MLFSVCGLIKCPPGSVMCISGLCSAEWSTDSPVLEDKVINVSRLGNSLVKCCFLFITIHISCWSLSAVKVLAQSLIYSRDCTYLIMSIALIVTIFLDFLIFYCDLFLKRYTYIYIFLYVVLFVQIFFHTCILGKVFGFRFHEALIKLVSVPSERSITHLIWDTTGVCVKKLNNKNNFMAMDFGLSCFHNVFFQRSGKIMSRIQM